MEGDTDQIAADLDQTQADSDQTASDDVRMASAADQALTNRDQDAPDRDQAAADWERAQASGTSVSGQAYATSRDERDAAGRQRDSTAAGRSRTAAERMGTAAARDEVARMRDLTAAVRDRTAQARDTAADARDRAADAREHHAAEAGNMDDSMIALRELRALDASRRHQSGLERMAATTDREASARDRERAGVDRRYADLDDLTGVFRRGAGELAVVHEISRVRRLGRRLVLAVIDVDALKAVNDTEGHAAGDALLRDVPTAITSATRAYDVTVRWGGDEFVCVMSDVVLEVASRRLTEIQRVFTALHPGASVSAGLAELADDDTVESLVARADTALYDSKAANRV